MRMCRMSGHMGGMKIAEHLGSVSSNDDAKTLNASDFMLHQAVLCMEAGQMHGNARVMHGNARVETCLPLVFLVWALVSERPSWCVDHER